MNEKEKDDEEADEAARHMNPMRRCQRKSWKSEDLSRKEEPHSKGRNNDWQK